MIDLAWGYNVNISFYKISNIGTYQVCFQGLGLLILTVVGPLIVSESTI